MEIKVNNNPQTVLCSLCKQEKDKSAFTLTQRKRRNPSNRKCKLCLQKLMLHPNYTQF